MFFSAMGSYLAAGVVALAALAAGPAAAASPCDGALTTSAMVNCFGDLLSSQDRRLNAIYQRLMSPRVLDDESRVLLRDAQRAWISFRDAECAWQGDTFRGGTQRGVVEIGCKGDMTKTRVDQLQQEFEARSRN